MKTITYSELLIGDVFDYSFQKKVPSRWVKFRMEGSEACLCVRAATGDYSTVGELAWWNDDDKVMYIGNVNNIDADAADERICI